MPDGFSSSGTKPFLNQLKGKGIEIILLSGEKVLAHLLDVYDDALHVRLGSGKEQLIFSAAIRSVRSHL